MAVFGYRVLVKNLGEWGCLHVTIPGECCLMRRNVRIGDVQCLSAVDAIVKRMYFFKQTVQDWLWKTGNRTE